MSNFIWATLSKACVRVCRAGAVDTEISTNAVEGLCECSSEDIKQEQAEGIVTVYVFGIQNMSHFQSESIINMKPHWYIPSTNIY